MYNRTLLLGALLLSTARCTPCADAITISDRPDPLFQLAWQLSDRYGYLVTVEDAPIDQEHEVIKRLNAAGRVSKSGLWKPVTFHVPRAQATGVDGVSTDISGPEGILPLSGELIQPMVDEYNRSGNPSRFAVSFDGTYAHIYAISHSVNGKMESFEPILSTRVTMPQQATPCYQALDDLYAELRKMRGVAVDGLQIPPNWEARHECTITGADLTARDVLIQIVHEFGYGTAAGGPPVEPGRELRITWWLGYDINTEKYYLSMDSVPNKTPTAAARPGAPAQGEKLPVATDAPAGTDINSTRTPKPPAY